MIWPRSLQYPTICFRQTNGFASDAGTRGIFLNPNGGTLIELLMYTAAEVVRSSAISATTTAGRGSGQ